MNRILLIATAAFALASAAGAGEPAHTISVRGEARISLPPELAAIDLGVTNQGDTAAKALADNAAKMAKVIAAIRAQGIRTDAIKTAAFQIQPRYAKRTSGDYDDEALRPIVGYAVSNRVAVTLDKLGSVSKVIDAAVAAGANSADSVTFSLKNPERALDAARAEAVKAARHKAEILAAAAGATLGRAIAIADDQAAPRYGNEETVFVTAKRVATPIEPGEISLTVTVGVVYELQ